MSDTYTKKEVAKLNLEQAIRDYIAAAQADGEDSEEVLEQIKNSVFDGSEKQYVL